jgi:hypothetical protein
MTTQELHNLKVHELAEKYKNQGYNVMVAPLPSQLPDFLSSFQPDLLVTKPDDNLVIEVKAKQSLRFTEETRRLADIVSRRPGWRFDLVLYLDDNIGVTDLFSPSQVLAKPEIEGYLAEVDKLFSLKLFTSAFLLAWTATEATLRYLAKHHVLMIPTFHPLVFCKELAYQGIISSEQYNLLSQLIPIRNSLVHGIKTKPIEENVIIEIKQIIRELLQEAELANSVSV